MPSPESFASRKVVFTAIDHYVLYRVPSITERLIIQERRIDKGQVRMWNSIHFSMGDVCYESITYVRLGYSRRDEDAAAERGA